MYGDEQAESRPHGNPKKPEPQAEHFTLAPVRSCGRERLCLPTDGYKTAGPLGREPQKPEKCPRWASGAPQPFQPLANQTPRRANATRTDSARNITTSRGKGAHAAGGASKGGKGRDKRKATSESDKRQSESDKRKRQAKAKAPSGSAKPRPKATNTPPDRAPRPPTGPAAPPRRGACRPGAPA